MRCGAGKASKSKSKSKSRIGCSLTLRGVGEWGVEGLNGDGPGCIGRADAVGVGAAADDADHGAIPQAQDGAAAVAQLGVSPQAEVLILEAVGPAKPGVVPGGPVDGPNLYS